MYTVAPYPLSPPLPLLLSPASTLPHLSCGSDEVRGAPREVGQLEREGVAALISQDVLNGAGGI